MVQDALSAAQILDVAEAGARADAATRGTVLLAAGDSAGRGEQVLAGLSLGEREATLLEVRRATFGEVLPARTSCPACGAGVAVDIPAGALRVLRPAAEVQPVQVRLDGLEVTARAPDGEALAAAARAHDPELAREALLRACVLSARDGAREVDPLELSDHVATEVGAALVAADPACELGVELQCAACEHEWRALFDAASFLWEEVAAMSVRLIDEIDILARAYHWSEPDILALSSPRRRRYIERVVADG